MHSLPDHRNKNPPPSTPYHTLEIQQVFQVNLKGRFGVLKYSASKVNHKPNHSITNKNGQNAF